MLFNAGFRSENPDELMTIVRIRGSPFLKSGLRICALRTTFQKWASRTLIINYIESVIFLREAEMDFPWDCLIFHDVDLLPLNDTNPYSCSKAQYYHALRLLSSLAVNLIIRTFFLFQSGPSSDGLQAKQMEMEVAICKLFWRSCYSIRRAIQAGHLLADFPAVFFHILLISAVLGPLAE